MASADAILLDTHVWLWVYLGAKSRLGQNAVTIIDAALEAGTIYLSATSIWETSQLVRGGRIQLHRPLRDWIAAAVRALGGRVLPIDSAVALESQLLPAFSRGDPGDRFLIATARQHRLRLATADHVVLTYGAGGHVEVLDVER